MFTLKNATLSRIVGLMTLMALFMFLVACQSSPDPAADSFGLRSEAVQELLPEEPLDGVAAAPAEGVVDAIAASDIAAPAAGQAGRGQGARTTDRTNHVLDPLTATDPTTADIDGLVYMREEEKLARDVYLALSDLWGLPVFQNIAGSEQAHMDSILLLLEGYGVADPAAGNDPGQFSDPTFASLYQDLVAQGSASIAEALKVGATIEELDIVDLRARLDQTENANIIQVYNNLLAGSENHLRAFVSNLERQGGEPYQPHYLSQEAYQAILAGQQGQGHGGHGAGGSGNGGAGNGGNGGNGRRNG